MPPTSSAATTKESVDKFNPFMNPSLNSTTAAAMMDQLSSTHALLNLARSATAMHQVAQQQQQQGHNLPDSSMYLIQVEWGLHC
jgi:hypothetical protein